MTTLAAPGFDLRCAACGTTVAIDVAFSWRCPNAPEGDRHHVLHIDAPIAPLRAVEHVERLAKIGVDSLKVEGRTKSLYYVARTAQVYRRAIDDAVAGRPFNPELLGELNGLANRGYTDGFYQRHHTQDHQNYMEGVSQAHRSQYVGQVTKVEDGWAEVQVKNRFSVGDRIEIISPAGNEIVTLGEMRNTENQSLNMISGAGHTVRIPLDGKYEKALIAKML